MKRFYTDFGSGSGEDRLLRVFKDLTHHRKDGAAKDQVDLACQMQAAGADMLQVENLEYDSEYENAKAIVKAVEIPVILSGKIDATKIEKALATGVNGLGIGNAINSKKDLPSMVEEVKASMKAMEVKAIV